MALFLLWVVPFLAGMVIGKHWIGLAVWFGLAALFFLYVEALVLCRHCPHYAEEGFLLKCHANSGFPKIPKFDPRPLNIVESTVWLIYIAVLFLYYIPFFVIGQQWLLLGITTLALVTTSWTLQRTQCTRCFHLCTRGAILKTAKGVGYHERIRVSSLCAKTSGS
jgi:hypothetical protein